MRFAELPKIGLLCDLALAGVLVALLARPGSPQLQVIRQVDGELVTTPCAAIGNVELIGERTIVTLPEPLADGRCHSHVREYLGDVGPANLVREYDRY